MTRKVLSLNERSDLREHRADAVLKFQAAWAQLASASTSEKARRTLQKLYDGAGPGTLAVRILYDRVKNPITVRPPSPND